MLHIVHPFLCGSRYYSTRSRLGLLDSFKLEKVIVLIVVLGSELINSRDVCTVHQNRRKLLLQVLWRI